MALTSQDLKKGIDITGLVVVTGSELNQLVDAGRLADDKGINITTTDTALNTPVVPNPDAPLEGVTPIWWKRYKWVRKPFDATGVVITYNWNELQPVDPTFLNWIPENVVTNSLQQEVDELQTDVTSLQTQTAANANGILANTNAIAENTEDIHLNQVSSITAIDALRQLIAIQCPPGTVRTDASSAATEGWLLCDGSSYLRTDYPELFARIGTSYGAVDSTHFNVPDPRGRAIVGAGNGTGLTPRPIGSAFGVESITLTGGQSGSKAHNHALSLLHSKASVGFSGGASNIVTLDNVDPVLAINTDSNTAVDAADAHSNIQPSLAFALFIKT